jgi:hypothetical protein
MAVINAAGPVVVTDGNGTPDGRGANHPPLPGEPVAVEQYIADLLHRAHLTAEAAQGPDEARAILHVAQLFAEDLARADPHFDRVELIEAITGEPA